MSFGQTMPFHPLIDLCRRRFGIEERDTDADIVAKIDDHVAGLGHDLTSATPFIRHLLSVDPGEPSVATMDPKLRRAEVFNAVLRLLQCAAEKAPQIVVLEDAHWMDQATTEFLTQLADAIAMTRLLLVVSHRPGYTPPFGDRSFHTRMALQALSPADSAAMASALLGAKELPAELEALIARKAEGNPFFVEEIVQSLKELKAVRRVDGTLVVTEELGQIEVPDTIQELILARIERLDEQPKRALHVASVIGREFTHRLVERLIDVPQQTEQWLGELKQIEFIYEGRVAPEHAYMFKHALTQEVAYQSQQLPQRKELHRLIGAAIEELYADRLPEHYEVLAHHFVQANEWDKAINYLVKGAEKAAGNFATREALALYDQALEAVVHRHDPVDRSTVMAVHQAKAQLYFVVSDFARSRAEAERLCELAREARDLAMEANALAALAWAATWSRDLDGAIASAKQAIAVAKPAGVHRAEARGHFTIGFVRAVCGGLDEAKRELDTTIRICETTHDPVHQSLALTTDGLIRAVGCGGLLDEAKRELDTTIRICETTHDPVHQSLALTTDGLIKNWAGEYAAAAEVQSKGLTIALEHNLLVPSLFSYFLYGLTLTGRGDYDKALVTFQEGLSLAERVGDEAIHHRLLNCLGWLYTEVGDYARAEEANHQSRDIGRRRNDPGTFPNATVNLGDISVVRGDLALAQNLYDEAYSLWRDPEASEWMRWRYSIRLFASLGQLCLTRGDVAQAQEFANRCLEMATATNSRKNTVKGWRLTGDIARAKKAWDEAEDAYRKALAVAQPLGNPPQLWKSHLALGRLHEDLGRIDAARAAYRQAHAIVERVGASLTNEQLRSAYASATFVKEIGEFARR